MVRDGISIILLDIRSVVEQLCPESPVISAFIMEMETQHKARDHENGK